MLGVTPQWSSIQEGVKNIPGRFMPCPTCQQARETPYFKNKPNVA